MSKMKDVYETLIHHTILMEHAEGVKDESVRNALLYMLYTNRPEIDEYGQTTLKFDEGDEKEAAGEINRLTKDEEVFSIFNGQMVELKNNLHQQSTPLTMKMNFAYAVTLMETCLADMLKHAVLSESEFMSNALKNIKDFHGVKIDLIDIHKNSGFVTGFVMKVLTEYLYHKIELVLTIYRFTLGSDHPEYIKEKIGDLVKIADIRHDIVHRNGFDKEGNEHHLTPEKVAKAMQDIIDFVQGMKMYISQSESGLSF
ncbi:hypothetical protein [Pectobacterium sp. CHL-2024]|uniref:hypothetical protein n=1 Tax=Pectobacterium sp. CHL-2024 TaxID=3377079 RepID=UPI003822EE63